MTTTYRCPVCGYGELNAPPHNPISGGASDEICPSCGFQFGFDDDDRHISYEEWRERWVNSGMQWSSVGRPQPAHWNPVAQVAGLKSES